MKQLWMIASAAIVLGGSMATIAIVNTAEAQQPDKPYADQPDSKAKMFKGLTPEQADNMKQYATPGAAHEQLVRRFAGTWTCEGKMWYDDDQKEGETTSGTIEYKSIFGGRYLEAAYSSLTPMSVEGRSIVGFDNLKKEYFLYCINNMGTGVMYLTGAYDEKMRTYTFEGDVVNPANRDESEPCKQEIKLIDDNHFMLTMWQDGDKIYEATVTRQGTMPKNR